MDRLGISLSKTQSTDLYHELCSFLVTKDTFAYIDLLRTKYELLQEGVSLRECDYKIMENLLEKIESEYTLILNAIAYTVKYQS